MANHGFADPAANFTYISGGESQPGVFQLQAMRNISAGEEVREKCRPDKMTRTTSVYFSTTYGQVQGAFCKPLSLLHVCFVGGDDA